MTTPPTSVPSERFISTAVQAAPCVSLTTDLALAPTIWKDWFLSKQTLHIFSSAVVSVVYETDDDID